MKDKNEIKKMAIRAENIGNKAQARTLWDLYYGRPFREGRGVVEQTLKENLGQDVNYEDLPSVINNHTGYSHPNSANWEHDNTGCISNYSGMSDMIDSANAEHDGWEEGYDY